MLIFKNLLFFLILGVFVYGTQAYGENKVCKSAFKIWAIYEDVEFDKDGNPVVVGSEPREFYLSKDMGTPSLLLVKNDAKKLPSSLKITLVKSGAENKALGSFKLNKSKKHDGYLEVEKLALDETIENLDVNDALEFHVEDDSKMKCPIKIAFDNVSHTHDH